MNDEIRDRYLRHAQGASTLHAAFVGIASGLVEAFATLGSATAEEAAETAGIDAGYARRWCEVGYAFGFLDRDGEGWRLTEEGRALHPDAPDSLMPFAWSAVLGAHMAERAASLAPSGERPGSVVLTERPILGRGFGPMLERRQGPVFEEQVLGAVPVFAEIGERGGLVVDLGCGNGWYLRRLLRRYPRLRGLGVDGFEASLADARARAEAEGFGERLRFARRDLVDFRLDEPAILVAMNRALHHVWEAREALLGNLLRGLAPGGALAIWEPAWPEEVEALRRPGMAGIALGNLGEHVQGNHFLTEAQVRGALEALGARVTVHRVLGGRDMVVVARPG